MLTESLILPQRGSQQLLKDLAAWTVRLEFRPSKVPKKHRPVLDFSIGVKAGLAGVDVPSSKVRWATNLEEQLLQRLGICQGY